MRFLGAIAPGAVLAMLLSGSDAAAQWLNVPRAAIPRTADGQPDLKAPAPRRPDGKPDLTGIWRSTDNKYLRDLAVDMKPEDVPYQPWAKALFEARKGGAHSREDPDAHCLPQGVPKIDSVAYPVEDHPDAELLRLRLRDVHLLAPDLHRRAHGGPRRQPDMDGLLHRALGRRCVRRRHPRVQRQGLARPARAAEHRPPARDRAVHAARYGTPGHRRHDRRPRRLHAAVVGAAGDLPAARLGTARVHLRREQSGRREAAGRKPRRSRT